MNKNLPSQDPELSQQDSTLQMNHYQEIIQRRIEEHLNLQNPIYVNLGVDLGTSFTKVAWRFGETTRPVCFTESSKSLNDYLVPSIVVFDGKSFQTGIDLFADREKEADTEIHNFKMCLACESADEGTCSIQKCSLAKWNTEFFPVKVKGEETFLIASIYLGKLLSAVKKNIESQLFDDMGYQTEPVFWSANLAVPEKLMEQSPVLSAFENVFKIAYLMSYVFDEIPDMQLTDEIVNCYEVAKEIAAVEALDCFVYPEVGAQVASVTMSRTTADGLYAFVDIGAGTVDVSIFRLNSNQDERKLETYAAEVIRAGAAHYEQISSNRLALESIKWLRNVKEKRDDLQELEISSVREMLETFLQEAGSQINQTVEKNLVLAFSAAYKKEPLVDRWYNLQLVRGGGGSALPVYHEASNAAFTLKLKPKIPPQEAKLPVPSDFNLVGLPAIEFHRFAVAYGLSFNFMDLPKISLADEVEAIKINYKGRSFDDFYAK